MRRASRRRAGLPKADLARLDHLARECAMLRANVARFDNPEPRQPSWWGACLRCGRENWLSWCHVVTRANYHTRWDRDNSFAWCAGCHRMLDQYWEQKQSWVEQRIGAKAYAALLMRSRIKGKMDFVAVRLALEQERAAMLNRGE